jgi:RNA polymerase sigma-70 factor (ECF subfamily)
MAEAAKDMGQWLTAARAGSRDALGQALEACRCYLLLVAGDKLASELQAKGGASDLVQETFVEAQRDFGRFQGTSEAELLAWLRQLLLHRLANFRRRFRQTKKRGIGREVALEGDNSSLGRGGGLVADIPSPSGEVIADEQAQALERALERLPEDYQRVITMRYREERSFEEIGRLLQRSPEAARKLWWRAIERLQQELETPP